MDENNDSLQLVKIPLILFSFFQGAFACDMILLYMMNTSSFYRERKFEIINFKYD